MQLILIFPSLVTCAIIQNKIIPDKLLHYQNVTGIDDEMVLEIFDKSLKGEMEKYKINFQITTSFRLTFGFYILY